jgi:hypothetical protein
MIPADDVHVMSVSLKLGGDPRKCTYEATYLQRLRVHARRWCWVLSLSATCTLKQSWHFTFVINLLWSGRQTRHGCKSVACGGQNTTMKDNTRILKDAEGNARGKACACTHTNSTALVQSAIMATCGHDSIFRMGQSSACSNGRSCGQPCSHASVWWCRVRTGEPECAEKWEVQTNDDECMGPWYGRGARSMERRSGTNGLRLPAQ